MVGRLCDALHTSRVPRSTCPADKLEKTQETPLPKPEVSVDAGRAVCVGREWGELPARDSHS